MKHLVVRNFGPVRNADITIKAFNLFIGEQSIGKSTLAKLVTIFTDHVNLFMLKSVGSEVWTQMMETYDLSVYAGGDYHILYTDDNLDGAQVSIAVDKGAVTCHVMDENNTELDESGSFKRILGAKPMYHPDTLHKLETMEASPETLPTFLSYMLNSLYIPAERIVGAQLNKLLPIISMGKEQLPMNMLRYLSELNNAKAKYSDMRLELLNVSYQKKDDEDWIVLDNKDKIQLKYASSGIQSALPLLLVLIYGAEDKDYSSFVVEEPECNLFPQKQVDLLKLMIKTIYQNDRMLTITTHSPYLLSSLNVLMLAHRLYQDETLKEQVAKVVEPQYMLDSDEVSVYFLGDKEHYCVPMKSDKTGMISVNQLDSISEYVGEQFDQLYSMYVQSKRH